MSEIIKSRSIRDESFKLNPSAVINLFQIDLNENGSYFFHAGENGFREKLVFNSQEYQYIPLKAEGFEQKGDGGLPRPRLTISNYHGFLSLKLRRFEDFIGYKVIRTKTFIKFLDAVNFPNSVNPYFPNDNEELGSHFPKDEYYINQKIQENADQVDFELTSILEIGDASIPARIISPDYCNWTYRGSVGCQYTGVPVADSSNKKFIRESGYEAVGTSEEANNDQNRSLMGYDVTTLRAEYSSFYLDVPMASGSYNLTDLNNSGIWQPGSGYSSGDYVMIPSFDINGAIAPSYFYACTSGDADIKTDPRKDSLHWKEDQCSKSVLGCRLRFGNKAPQDREASLGLPFGGFPGVQKYDVNV